ncbi:MAG: hypothetical protein HRU07_04540 [Nitrosopumilus sp.]|nr:hypothetical protein [Nitrosopumilus sp.]NRA05421.1 hypothetical protein [Nitrosopumilus sp.]
MIKIGMIFASILFAVILIASFTMSSYADYYIPPKKQLESGILPEDVLCRDGKVLVIRDNGNPACVRELTAVKMNWNIIIIATETVAQMIIPSSHQEEEVLINDKEENVLIEHESTENDEIINNDLIEHKTKQPTQYIEMNLGSDVEYVDDGREIHYGLQRSPAPENIYELIIDNQEDNDIDPYGMMRVPAGFGHEKYSIVSGIGLYPADWMPIFIPDGYKLLFFENFNYEDTTGDAVLRINFVPNTFQLTNQTTTHDIKRSEGYMVRVSYQSLPFDEIEDRIEADKEDEQSKPGYVGRWLDIARDGKTVYASETQTFYDDYRSIYSFSPNDNLIVGVLSYHHTLEELKPIFDSVMN